MDNPNMMEELLAFASKGFDFPENEIPVVFLDHYYEWEGRLRGGCAPQ